jgi:hypothetical protein
LFDLWYVFFFIFWQNVLNFIFSAKLLSRATKIAYTLLNKTVVIPSTSSGNGKERVHFCLPGDRVALVYIYYLI